MRVFVPLAVAALALAGCSESSVYHRTLESQGALSVAPGAAGELVVSIRNLKDVGMDLDNKATRDGMALSYLAAQCPAGRVVGETAITTGTYLLGNPARTYAIRVRCA